MTDEKVHDTAVIGGGLAGLAVSIQLARAGHAVVLFEKEQYPFHKVCGEYISLESWDFLNTLGIDLNGMSVPIITRVEISSVNGKLITRDLPLGGFGISRYKLDAALADNARKAGVVVMENTKVTAINFNNELFTIDCTGKTFQAKTVSACWGKRSNIDIKWQRPFAEAAQSKLNNYIGVKYHITGNFAANTIALHNFKNGYCGIVKIEDDLYNLCYLTTAANLQQCRGDIREMEEQILCRNPHLRKIFLAANIPGQPFTISQISFDKKTLVERNVLMLGDAAGMITPLCGNGMSMALHSGKLAATQIDHFLKGAISREKMEKRYSFQWQRHFKKRLRTGRRLQKIFGSAWLGNIFVSVIKPFPGLLDRLIRETHGKGFL